MSDKDLEKLKTAKVFLRDGDAEQVKAAAEWAVGELERLTTIGDRIEDLLRRKREDLVELEADRARCVENGWDEGLERIDETDLPVRWAEIRLLELVYG